MPKKTIARAFDQTVAQKRSPLSIAEMKLSGSPLYKATGITCFKIYFACYFVHKFIIDLKNEFRVS